MKPGRLSSKKSCAVPTDFDKQYAEKYNVSPLIPMALRTFYTDRLHIDLTKMEDTEQAIESLYNFSKNHAFEAEMLASSMKGIGENITESYQTVTKKFTVKQRTARINDIVHKFQLALDNYQAKFGRSREDLISGATVNDNGIVKKINHITILNDIYKHYKNNATNAKLYSEIYHHAFNGKSASEIHTLMPTIPEHIIAEILSKAENKEGYASLYSYYNEREKKYNDIIENFSALTTFARVQLTHIENMSMGNVTEECMENLDFLYSQIMDNDMYNVEESNRESWQQIKDCVSQFDSLGTEVKRMLSRIPLLDAKGNMVFDDLNNVVYVDPLKAYKRLVNLTKGCSNSAEMLGMLGAVSRNDPENAWIGISDDTGNSTGLMKFIDGKNGDSYRNRTQLFVSLKKNRLTYHGMREKGRTFFPSLLENRRRKKSAQAAAILNALNGNVYSPVGFESPLSIFDKEGKITQETFDNVFKKNLFRESDEKNSGYIDGVNSDGIIEYSKSLDATKIVDRVLKTFGINYPDNRQQEIANNIIKNKKILREIIDNINYLIQYNQDIKSIAEKPFNEYLTSSEIEDDETNKKSLLNINIAKDRLKNIYSAISKAYPVSESEDAAVFKNEKGKWVKRYNVVESSFLGDLVEKINTFAKDRNALRHYIENTYLDNPFFAEKKLSTIIDDNGIERQNVEYKIYNRWLKYLYDATSESEDSFANKIRVIKMLGSNGNTKNLDFDSFNKKQQVEAMLAEHFMGVKKENREYFDSYDGKDGIQIRFDNKKKELYDTKTVMVLRNTNTEYFVEKGDKGYILKQRERSLYANMPVFVLGDSYASEYLTSPVFDEQEITDAFFDIYLQEIERAKIATAAYYKMNAPKGAIITKDGYITRIEKAKKEGEKDKLYYLCESSTDTKKHWEESTGQALEMFCAEEYRSYAEVSVKHYPKEIEHAVFIDGIPMMRNIQGKIYYAKSLDQISSVGKFNFIKNDVQNEDLIEASEVETPNISASPKFIFLKNFEKNFNLADDATKVKEHITEYLNSEYDKFFFKLEKEGIVVKDAEGKYTCPVLGSTIAIKYGISKYAAIEKSQLDSLLKQFYFNTKLATVEQLEMTTIDPAYYGLKVNSLGKVEGVAKDLQKRYKEIYASGQSLDIEALDDNGNPYMGKNPNGTTNTVERCLYFDDVKLSLEKTDRAAAKAIAIVNKYDDYKKYLKSTSTDGQGYRTLESYRKVMGAAGKWTILMEETYKDIISLREKLETGQIKKGDDEYNRLMKDIAEREVIYQPLKPICFAHERYALNGNEVMQIPVQHKYAEIVVIPELMPDDSKLAQMMKYASRNNIDLVCSTKCVKVGSFGSVNINGVNNVEGDMQLDKVLSKAYIHQIDYKGYRLQNNVPEHLNQDALFATQIRKLILNHLNPNIDAYNSYFDFEISAKSKLKIADNLELETMTGSNLMTFYNALIMANIIESLREFAAELNTPEKISDSLIQSVINNGRGNSENLIAFSLTNDEKFLMPLFEGTIEHDAISHILSKFRKRVNKQKIKGGSAVQASSLGLTGIEEDGNLHYVVDEKNDNILYVECEMPFDLSYIDYKGNEVQLNEDDYNRYCEYDGSLKLDKSNPIDESDPRYKEYLGFKGEDGKVYMPLIEKDFPHILERVAYRIPTEREYSMLNLKVKRFTRKFAGGIIKVPTGATTSAGFDFDIDKLYFMMYQHKEKVLDFVKMELSKQDVTDIFEYMKNDPEYSQYVTEEVKIKEETSYGNEELANIFNFIYGKTATGLSIENESPIAASFRKTFIKSFAKNGVTEQEASTFFNNLKGSLKTTRFGEGGKLHLNQYWEEDPSVYAFAKKLGYAEPMAFKQDLINQAASLLGISGEVITNTNTWSSFDSNTVRASGKTKYQILNEIANKLNESRSEENKIKVAKVETGFEEYDQTKTVNANSKTARNNMLMNIIQHRLSDKETMQARYTPGGFSEHSEASRIIRQLQYANNDSYFTENGKPNPDFLSKIIKDAKTTSDPEPDFDISDPWTIIQYNEQNLIANKLIGIAVNQNTNHSFVSLFSTLKINSGFIPAFGEHTNGDLFDFKNGSVDIDANVAGFSAATVDAVKDPILNFLNLNTTTFNTAMTLARIGYSTLEIGLFLKQPIIMEYCRRIDAGEYPDAVEKELVDKLNKTTTKNQPNAILDSNTLALQIYDYSKTESIESVNARTNNTGKQGYDKAIELKIFNSIQKEVFDQFIKARKVAQKISDLIKFTKFTASNAIPSTIGGIYVAMDKIEELNTLYDEVNGDVKMQSTFPITMQIAPNSAIQGNNTGPFVESPIRNSEELLNDIFDNPESYIGNNAGSPVGYEQCMYDALRGMLKIVKPYIPYDTPIFQAARTTLTNAMPYNPDEDLYNALLKELPEYVLVYISEKNSELGYHGVLDNSVITCDGIEYDYRNSDIPLKNALDKYPIGEFFELSEKKRLVLTDLSFTLSPTEKDELLEAWKNLYEKQDKELAISLFKYCFFRYGISTTNSFIDRMPLELKSELVITQEKDENGELKDVTYLDIMNKILAGSPDVNSINIVNDMGFVQRFFTNHLNFRTAHKLYTKNGMAVPNGLFLHEDEIPYITLGGGENADKMRDEITMARTKNSLGNTEFLLYPILNIGNKYYIASCNGGSTFNAFTENSQICYKEIKPNDTGRGTNYFSKRVSGQVESSEEGYMDLEKGLTEMIFQQEMDEITFQTTEPTEELYNDKYQEASSKSTEAVYALYNAALKSLGEEEVDVEKQISSGIGLNYTAFAMVEEVLKTVVANADNTCVSTFIQKIRNKNYQQFGIENGRLSIKDDNGNELCN